MILYERRVSSLEFILRNPFTQNSIIEQIFYNRNYNIDINQYINVDERAVWPSDLLNNMETGARVLIRHISNNDKVLVVVDSDCDGYTSSAVLLNYLYRRFPGFTQNNISYVLHDDKSHGIIVDAISQDIKLILALDSSSNEYEIHRKLNAQGIDVLVLDHHEAEKVSEYACVINNQLDDYPNKTLSGVGIVYKFICYLDNLLSEPCAQDFLDLVALGLTGDMMSVCDLETRYFIKTGTQQIKNPFFQYMVKKQEYSIKGEVNPFKMSFYIVPFINAICRSGTMEEKILLFESMLEYKANEEIPSTKRGCKGETEKRVEQAIRTCTNVKSRQEREKEKGTENIENLIQKRNLLNHKILLILAPSDDWLNPNLRGLVANQLAAKYNHPTLILAKRVEEDGEEVWSGSGRGLAHSKLKDFREFLLSTGYVKWATGHANAFGCAIPSSKIKDFIQVSDKLLADYDFKPAYYVDFILDNCLDNATQVVSTIADYKNLWSQGLEEPLIAVKNIQLQEGVNLRYLTSGKRPTIKITLGPISCMKFGVPEEEYELLKNSTINLVGTCENNYWNGTVTPQIMIKDYELCEMQKKKPIYYF